MQLHADVLRPKGATAKTPVILSIGPYFNHAGQTGPAGPVEGTTYDPVGTSTGPSDRFLDFVEGAKLMQRGYSFVMVDLRGFGGSTGCLDWGGPGEQSDIGRHAGPVPDPGADREQHGRRRHRPVPARTTPGMSVPGSARGSTSAATNAMSRGA